MRKVITLLFVLAANVFALADFQQKVGQFAASTGGATTTVTGIGFTPKVIFFVTHGKTANAESNGASYAIGFSDGTNVFENGWANDNAVATTNAGASEQIAKGLQILSNGTPTVATGGSVNSVAFSSGQFVVTWNATPAAATLVDYVVFGGSDITNVFVGNSTVPGSTSGLQHNTGAGFQGNFILVAMNLQTAAGTSTASGTAIGAAVDTSKRWAFNSVTQDAQTLAANVNAQSWFSNAQFMTNQNINNAQIFTADFSGFTATGFDYTISLASASSYVYGYVIIKGGQWDVGSGLKPTTATTQTVTGEAFQPSFLGLFTSSATAVGGAGTSTQESSFGATDGTSKFFANAVETDTINTVAVSSGSTTNVLLDRDGTNNPAAAFTSFNSDGWTITWSTTGTAREVGWFTAAANPAGTATFMPVVY